MRPLACVRPALDPPAAPLRSTPPPSTAPPPDDLAAPFDDAIARARELFEAAFGGGRCAD